MMESKDLTENNQYLMKKLDEVQNLYNSKNFLNAEDKINELIKKFPKLANLHYYLGLVLRKKDEINKAIKAFEKTIELQPNFSYAFNNLGDIYKLKKKTDLAINNYKKAIKLDPNISEARNNLGNVYKSINKLPEAIDEYKKAIKKNPKLFVVQNNLGIAYKALGELNKAKICFLKVIKSKPDFYFAYRNLGLIIKWKKNDPAITKLKELFLNLKENNVFKRELAFTLGKIHDDISDYPTAFKYFKEASHIQETNTNYSIEYDKKLFAQIKSSFSKSLFHNNKQFIKSKNKECVPIFIIGMPRSGSTLIEQILSNHSRIFSCGEINKLDTLISKYFFKNNENFIFSNDLYSKKKLLRKVSNEYVENFKKMSGNSIYITDKMLLNFKWLGIIKLIFPNSKIIHCVRNSKDICLSIYKNFFPSKGMEFTYSLKNIVEYHNLYKNLMTHWYKILPGFFFDLEYKKLINHPESEIKKLLNYLDLKWENNCMDFHKSKNPVYTASDAQVRMPIYKDSIDSWKNYENSISSVFTNLE